MTSSLQNTNRIDALVRATRLMYRMSKARPEPRQSELLYYQMLIRYYERLLKARENGDFVAAHTVFFPSEVLYAMDIAPMHLETTSWMTALFLGEYADLLAAGAELGLASEICSPHRGLAGAFSIGALPKPDVVLWSNMVCDNTAKSGELLMKITGCPGHFLDHPFQDSSEEIAYFTDELKEMVAFLEDHSGRKMDWDRLSLVVGNMDKQLEILRSIHELRKAIPSPFHPQGFLELLTVDYLFAGHPEATEYLETLRQELEEAIAQGKGAVAKERYRLMTLFLPPMYLIGFLEKMSQEFGAVSVAEPFFCQWGDGKLDPKRPLESVALKSYMIPEMNMYAPMGDRAITKIRTAAQEFRIDGAIYYADVGCRHTCATIKLFKDILDDMDIPVLTLDCDVVDPTITSQEEIRGKLEGFFELLDDR